MKRIISTIISVALVLSSLVFATGCSSKQEIDLAKYVTFEGCSGMATLNTEPEIEDYDEQMEKLKEKKASAKKKDNDDKYEEYKEEMAQLRDLNNALEKVKFVLKDGEDGKIKNGDKITVKAKYNEEKIEKYDVEFTSDTITMTVKGLEEKDIIDPFDESKFTLTYSGLDGDGEANGKYDSDDVYIYYDIDPNYDLSNGDTIEVQAYCSNEDYMLKDCDEYGTATKEFTVEGLGAVPEKLDGTDTSEIDKLLLEKVKEDYSDLKKGEEDKGYFLGIEAEGYKNAYLKITKISDYKAMKGIYGYDGEDKECMYGKLYSRDVTVKVIDPALFGKKIKKGTTKTFTLYYIGYTDDDIMVSKDNKLTLDDPEASLYISTNFGDNKEDVIEDMEEYYDDFKFSDVK